MGAFNSEKKDFFWGGGVFLNNSKKLSFAILWNFFKPLKGCPKHMNAIKLGFGNFFCIENIFSSMPLTPPPPLSDLNSVWSLICYVIPWLPLLHADLIFLSVHQKYNHSKADRVRTEKYRISCYCKVLWVARYSGHKH